MTAINTNTGSLYAQQSLNTNARGLATVMQQLSTGKRINNAVDDVAGLAISTRLTSQIKGLNQAVRNANDGISLIQTAEGATEQVTNMLQRMRELAVQASNDTNNDKDRGFLNGEFQQLRAEIDRIGQNTQWNGANILDGTGGNGHDGTFSFQVGANSRQTIKVELPNLQTGIKGTDLDLAWATPLPNDATEAKFTFTSVDTFAGSVTASSYLGAVFELKIADQKFQYQVTQSDVDALNNDNVKLSNSIVTGFEQKLKSAFGADGATYDISDTDPLTGIVSVKPGSGTNAGLLVSGAASAKYVEGVLSSIGGEDIAITDANKAYEGLQAIDSALQTVNAQRSNMGALISRLQFASDNLSNVAAKAAESRSRIEDTDYSVATTELAKRNIIQQAAQAMLAQANQAPQMVLQLLK